MIYIIGIAFVGFLVYCALEPTELESEIQAKLKAWKDSGD